MMKTTYLTGSLLFLLLALGGGLFYHDPSLFKGWEGPFLIGSPLIAWALFTLAALGARKKEPEAEKMAEPAPPEPAEKEPPAAERPEPPTEPGIPEAVVASFVSTLQREGRLVDFLEEDLEPYDDAQVGAAAREVHRSLRTVFSDMFRLGPVIDAEEGAEVEVDEDYNPKEIRLLGSLKGPFPKKGILRHPGWRILEMRLPKWTLDPRDRIVAQAEVEVR